MEMFCFQCQEAAGGKGCTIQGVCGKLPRTAELMDVLLYAVRGEAIVNRALRDKGAAEEKASRQIIDALSVRLPTLISTMRRLKCVSTKLFR